jgi:hypothetical protein
MQTSSVRAKTAVGIVGVDQVLFLCRQEGAIDAAHLSKTTEHAQFTARGRTIARASMDHPRACTAIKQEITLMTCIQHLFRVSWAQLQKTVYNCLLTVIYS